MDVHHDHHHEPQNEPLACRPSNGETKLQPGNSNLKGEAPDNDKPKAQDQSLRSATNSSAHRKKENGEEIMRRLMECKKEKEGEVDLAPYKELRKVIKTGNWKNVKRQLSSKDPHALTTPITEFYETVLHILVKWKDARWLVEEIVKKIDPSSLEKTDYREDTALSVAASVGNVEAAKMMAEKNPNLLKKFNGRLESPFHIAAKFGQEETFYCLLKVARTSFNANDIERFFSGLNGAKIVEHLLSANLYSLTLDMLESYPKLCRGHVRHRKKVLGQLAKTPRAFKTGCKFGIWRGFIYKVISVGNNVNVPSTGTEKDDCLSINISNVDEDHRNPTNKNGIKSSIDHFIQNSPIRIIYDIKLENVKAREIVRLMCDKEDDWTFHDAGEALKEPAFNAARLGIAEIVKEILKVYPAATRFYDNMNHNILHIAVLHRQDKVFNLFFKRYLSQKWVPTYQTKDKENVLHLAGRCVTSSQTSGAALKMQLEMQWFMAVKSVVHPLLLEERNIEDKTPKEVFDDEHKELIKDGEQWMRDTASSCMVVDALIIAMVFAAIIAVPGNNEKGIPNFRNETPFKVFIAADAAALFSSSFSLLLFVRILTSRYAEKDFLRALPRRLLLGLITLIFSIAAMLVASSSALIMLIDAVPGPKVMIVRRWTLIPVTILAALPVVYFIWSQSRLLIDVLISTYQPPISFVKQNDD